MMENSTSSGSEWKNQSYLTDQQKKLLIAHVALNGTQYDKYLQFAKKYGVQPFSYRYLRKWASKYRSAIEAEKERQLYALRKRSRLDRYSRLHMLETIVEKLEERLQHAIDNGNDDLAIRLSEQLRKQLEAIAKERGEWLKDDNQSAYSEIHVQILENMARAAITTGESVDGEYTEVDGAEAPVQAEEAGL